MTDLRKAANMALQALEFSLPTIEDFGSKEQLTDCHRAIMALYKSLAQPEQASNEPPDYVEPLTSDYHDGWEEGFEAAKNLFKKESAPQNADPRLLLGRKDNCTALAQPEQEPVAWMLPDYGDVLSASEADGTGIYNIPLYTAPPKPEQDSISTNDHLCAVLRQVHDVLACTALPMKRKWVGLTDEEIKGILDCERGGLVDIKKAEQILKEKNGG
jgi:hypothetical protein